MRDTVFFFMGLKNFFSSTMEFDLNVWSALGELGEVWTGEVPVEWTGAGECTGAGPRGAWPRGACARPRPSARACAWSGWLTTGDVNESIESCFPI